MAKDFITFEKEINNLFPKDSTFRYNNELYKVNFSGKPTCKKGEPKTDVFVEVTKLNDNSIGQIKISVKKSNAEFLENKIKPERAEAIIGDNWSEVIESATKEISNKFEKRYLIFKDKKGKSDAGSITLGWKYEILAVSSGELSAKLDLNEEQVIEIYSGNKLPLDKKNSIVCGKEIKNSGVATSILIGDLSDFKSSQDVIDNLSPIKTYVKANPNVYLACKALNYRSLIDKYDGDRPLCVFIDWNIINNKLTPSFRYDKPLITGGKEVLDKLKSSLSTLNASNTNNLSIENIAYKDIVYTSEIKSKIKNS